MSENTKSAFKEVLKQKRLISKGSSSKPPTWLSSKAIENKYYRYINSIIRQYIEVTVKEIKPLMSDWNKEVKGFTEDSYPEDFTEIEKKWEQLTEDIFISGKDSLETEITGIAILVSIFNLKQWKKILKKTVGIEYTPIEAWERKVINSFVRENVALIKGLTSDYQKKITSTIIQGFRDGQTAEKLAKDLTSINKEFSTGKIVVDPKTGKKRRTQSRARLIARDQINKLNGQLTRLRQMEAGVNKYIWRTVRDERVRSPAHANMEGKYCRWDDPTVYSDDKGKTWKSRSTISGVKKHPGQDIQCRCFGEPVFEEIIEEVDEEIKKKT